MSGFAASVAAWAAKAKATERRVFEASVPALRESIVEGSEVTGSPGLPRLTGELAGSYVERIDELHGSVTTDAEYAQIIENGIRAGTPISYEHGGGPHGVALTRAGWQALVNDVAQREIR